MKEPKEGCCIICGKQILRDLDSQSLFCGSLDCLRKYADEIECKICGIHCNVFIKLEGIQSGRITKWILACPNHKENTIIRCTFSEGEEDVAR